MRHIIQRHKISFKNAISGLIWAYKTQPNYITHLVLSAVAIWCGIYFEVSSYEWIAIIILITLGLVIETLNTAIEVTTDAIDKNFREDIKTAKDVAAAAMLTYALGAFFVALIIFIPKILV